MTISFQSTLTLVISLSFLALSLILMFLAIRNALAHEKKIEQRIAGSADLGPDFEIKKSRNPLQYLGEHLSLPDAEDISRIRFKLARAGYYEESLVKTFYATRVLCLFTPQILIFIFWGTLAAKYGNMMPAAAAAFGAVFGLMLPDWYLRWRQSKQTQRCRDGFPDMMDLMVACIEAGLGLDATLIRVSHELGGRYPPLKINLEIMNLELRAGRDRHEAMMNFADRIGLEEAKALAIMLKQSEEMGSSIGKALRTFSEDMRLKRMLKAEEKAMALSAKLTVPLILFIFPTIMVMLILPAGIRVLGALA